MKLGLSIMPLHTISSTLINTNMAIVQISVMEIQQGLMYNSEIWWGSRFLENMQLLFHIFVV
jgi:hypothetical protein